jgi:uncharacterized membrane protein
MVHSARRTTLGSALIGAVAAALAAFFAPAMFLPLIAWDVTAVVYLVVTWAHIARLTAAETAADAKREDPTRAGADLGVVIAALASLVAVGYVIVVGKAGNGRQFDVDVGLSVASVIASWALVHTIFTLRYARLYYADENAPGGIDNHQQEPPRFTDFAYLAFTIGMTFQVSDQELTSSQFRAMVLRHALLAYLFGTVIIALTINLVASLGH